VAAGGLVFTAFSVRYQAEQTGLQVAASRAQADLQNEQQAQLVNIWAQDQFSTGPIMVTVENRSEEPIYQFRLYIAFATSGSGGYLAISTWSSFPPCREVTFDLRGIAESYAETARLMPPHRAGEFDYGLIFEDAGGQTWHRHASGMLHATPWLEYLSEPRTGSFLPPQIFQSFTPLMKDNFTAPEEDGTFISGGLVYADSCGQGT
jgi:hypothetical protein